MLAKKMACYANLYRHSEVKPGAIPVDRQEFDALCDVLGAAPSILENFERNRVLMQEVSLIIEGLRGEVSALIDMAALRGDRIEYLKCKLDRVERALREEIEAR